MPRALTPASPSTQHVLIQLPSGRYCLPLTVSVFSLILPACIANTTTGRGSPKLVAQKHLHWTHCTMWLMFNIHRIEWRTFVICFWNPLRDFVLPRDNFIWWMEELDPCKLCSWHYTDKSLQEQTYRAQINSNQFKVTICSDPIEIQHALMSDVSFYGVFDFALWLKEKLLFFTYG